MVLPPPAPHDAPRPGESAWLDSLKLALGLSRSGVLLLVDHARPELLGELVRALLPGHPQLEVHTEVRRVLDMPPGSTLVLVPRVEDADWLNLNRPLFAQQELRVVLFCDTETTVALARQAVDFFDWISHRVECPRKPPRFAVEGLCCALAARAPGIVWGGGDLEATFAAARPRGKLHRLSAARPYGELLSELRAHRRAWIAVSEVNSQFRLRHVRWALAEAGCRTRVILDQPTVGSPGWWLVHARLANLQEARTQLEEAGVPFPGRLAALNELEPEAIVMMRLYLKTGISPAALEATLMGAATPMLKPKHSMEDVGRQFASLLVRGEAPPPLMRAFTPGQLRRLREAEFAALHQRLERGEPVELKDLASWTAWATKLGPDLSSWSPELAAEAWLRNRAPTKVRWNVLILWANAMMNLDAAESWAQRAVSENYPHARAMLASTLYAQGRHDEAASLIQELLADKEQTPGQERIASTSMLSTMVGVLTTQGQYREAEALLRQALSTSEQEDGALLRGALIYQLAKVLSAQRRYSETEALLRQSLETEEQSQGINLLYRWIQLSELAKAVAAQGRYDEAESLLRQSLSLLRSTMGDEHPMVGAALHDLATLLRLRGRYAEAEPLFRQALSLKEQTPGDEHSSYAASLSGLASTLRIQGKYEEAEARQRQALAIEERALGKEHLSYASSVHGLAVILQDQGRYAEAEALFRQALVIRERTLGSSHVDLCATLSNLGAVLTQQGRPSEGEPFILRALDIARAEHGLNHPDTARTLNLLAQIQDVSGNSEAPETARKALASLMGTLGPEHPYTQGVKPTLQAIIAKASVRKEGER